MKKITLLLGILFLAMSASARIGFPSLKRANKTERASAVSDDKSDAVYQSISRQYASGKISADSVINLALYHKVMSPVLAEKCLKLVSRDNPRAQMELGVIYLFTPEYASHAAEGLKLLQEASASSANGTRDALCYLGLYYFNHKDYAKARECFESYSNIPYGFGDTALGLSLIHI